MTAAEHPGDIQPTRRRSTSSGNRTGVIAAVVGVVTLGVGLLGGYLLFDDSDDVDDLEAQVSALEAQVGELEQAASDQQAQVGEGAAALQDEIDRLEAENQALQNQITAGLARLESTVSYVGDVVGRPAAEVTAESQRFGWAVTEVPLLDTGSAQGTVVLQAPAVGTPMVAGSSLVLYVAAELSDVGVDQAADYVGQAAEGVLAEASSYGWVVTIQTEENDGLAPGTIVAQDPAPGTPMIQGSSLVLTVAIPTPTTTTTTGASTTSSPSTTATG